MLPYSCFSYDRPLTLCLLRRAVSIGFVLPTNKVSTSILIKFEDHRSSFLQSSINILAKMLILPSKPHPTCYLDKFKHLMPPAYSGALILRSSPDHCLYQSMGSAIIQTNNGNVCNFWRKIFTSKYHIWSFDSLKKLFVSEVENDIYSYSRTMSY